MKIIVSAGERNLDGPVDSRFARANTFVLYDLESGEHTFLDNTPSLTSAQGAGVQTAHLVIQSGAEVLLTGHCGPKAFKALKAADIAVYVNVKGPIHQAIRDFKDGVLTQASQADVEGHWI
ncbi:NifB/NifX family molybdenum-iron cluster-binding protein [candidate division KSB1 bacterium]|nr:NifB/NifX family molybdenum-iron cluster-binding protein [candidate division KSB1 bacterium]